MNKLDEIEDIAFDEIDESDADNALAEARKETVYKPISEYTDETIPQEIIDEMWLMGQPKPPNITWLRWQSLDKTKFVHELMLNMHVQGYSQDEIAKALEYSPRQVCLVLRSPIVKEQIAKKREEMFGKDAKKAFTKLMNKAVGVYNDIIDDETIKPQVRLAAAQHIVEHNIGKPQQTVEHKGGLLSEFMTMTSQLREVESTDPSLTKEPDAIDNLIAEMIPKGVTVGQRGGNSEK